MEELKQRIHAILIDHEHKSTKYMLNEVMEEIEKWDNSCSMANDMNEEKIKELESICDNFKHENIRNMKILDGIEMIINNYKNGGIKE